MYEFHSLINRCMFYGTVRFYLLDWNTYLILYYSYI